MSSVRGKGLCFQKFDFTAQKGTLSYNQSAIYLFGRAAVILKNKLGYLDEIVCPFDNFYEHPSVHLVF